MQVVETVLKVSPDEGARLFSPMCIDVVRAVLESEVRKWTSLFFTVK
jgi:hypothetical protein